MDRRQTKILFSLTGYASLEAKPRCLVVVEVAVVVVVALVFILFINVDTSTWSHSHVEQHGKLIYSASFVASTTRSPEELRCSDGACTTSNYGDCI